MPFFTIDAITIALVAITLTLVYRIRQQLADTDAELRREIEQLKQSH